MATYDDVLQAIDETITDGARRELMHNTADDIPLDGRLISLGGQPLVNFGSCSYLGLETHPDLTAGVVAATRRYGTQFSSSRAYLSAPGYAEAESLLSELFGRPALITPSTTLGHVAALPTLLGPQDALLMDHQVHNSVQTAAKLVGAQGNTVQFVPHNDLTVLEDRIRELSRGSRRIWYAADGLYSMYADFAPIAELAGLMARYPQLWLYLDDAHSISWTGRHGRGHVLEQLPPAAAARTVVAGSLNKSFAAAGGVLTFPDEELRRRVFTVGGPLIFSGPVQPPMLGAITASARLHLSPQIEQRQLRLLELIRLFNTRCAELGLPLVSPSEAPIRCVAAGVPRIAYRVTSLLRQAGYFVDTAVFPAVSAKRCGTRITITAHHTREDVEGIVAALATALPVALAEEGSSPDILSRAFARQLAGRPVRLASPDPTAVVEPAPSRLVLQRYHSIDELDRTEWDQMFAGRGAMESSGLRALERAFSAGPDQPLGEDRWRFAYWVVRDLDLRRPIAATFVTTALWKDDMLSSAELSAEVEALRAADPHYLTSTLVATGSLLTEGNHLFLDRSTDWRTALRLILQAARAEQELAGADGITLRDLPDGDTELHAFLMSEGFVRLPVPTSWVRTVDFDTDEEFLAGLTSRPRHHQRRQVLGLESNYRVRVVRGGIDPAPEAAELDHLHRLYRNVHERNLGLNVFPLPRRLLDVLAGSPGWELVLLELLDGPGRPVAFVAQHIGPQHVQPLFLGLDYDYVASHGSYQQVLWQAVRSAQRHGAPTVLFGMSADRHKARFGARPERRWLYAQSAESYNADVLLRLAQNLSLSG